jgi:hypothetical protein
MATITIEKDPSTKITTELDHSITERLWKLEKQFWRGTSDSEESSWHTLISEIFNSYLKGKGY